MGAIVLNSLKDGSLFKAACSLCQKAFERNPNLVTVMAMTDSMQKFTDHLVKQKNEAGRKFPPLVFVLNETEVVKFARRFSKKVQDFIRDEHDLPDIRLFADVARVLRENLGKVGRVPRFYVTLGSRGSLGVDGDTGLICYVSSYTKRGAQIYDTNACGDAYCSAIALLEWATNNGYPEIGRVQNGGKPISVAHEMTYFMAVATAVAFCKATDRRGRVDSSEVRDLLDNIYLATVVLPNVDQICKGTKSDFISSESGRLKIPGDARFQTVTDDLAKLMRGD